MVPSLCGFRGEGEFGRHATLDQPVVPSMGVLTFGLGPDKFSWAEIARDIRRLTDPAFPIACLVDVTNLQRPV